MLRRIPILLTVLVLGLPVAAHAQDREWEEDYTQDEWRDERPAEDDYDVSVDLNESGTVDFDTFHGPLSSYGEWVSVGGHGRVWRPRVAAGWRPYYYGRWEWTNEGWLWVSDEPWGWASYHYGRWTYDGYYGWVWVPGYQWAPAWVAWRYSGDAVGWAPLGPGVSVYVSNYPFVDFWWTFVPTVRFVSVPVYTVAYAPTYTRRYFYNTSPAPPRPVARAAPGVRAVPAPAWGGPAPRAIEQRIGRPVSPVRIVPAPGPGAARVAQGEVSVYRPGARPAPARTDGWRRGGGASPPGNALAPRGGSREVMPAPRGRSEGFAPAPRGDGGARGAPAPRGERGGAYVPRGRGEDAPPAAAPRERESRSYAPAQPRGGDAPSYAPPPRERSGGSYAPPPAPRSDRGGGGGGGGGGARPAPSRGGGDRGDRGAPAPRESHRR